MRVHNLVIGVLAPMAAFGGHAVPPAPNVPVLLDVAAASARREAIAILAAGSLHGDEVPADAVGDWLALVREGDTAVLRPVTVTLVPERDIVDEEGEQTGRRVDVSPPLDPMALVRGVPAFTGEVTTALMDQQIQVGHAVDARLNNLSYRLSLRCVDIASADGYRRQECALMLRSDAVRQALFTYAAAFSGKERIWSSEKAPLVFWAGDLDLDGGLDILLDTSSSSNVSEMRLFLSSAATPTQLVSEVAHFTHVGC